MTDPDRTQLDLRDRAVLPVLIPVVAIILVEVLVFFFSRVLLATGGTPAAIIGLVVALATLFGCAAVAAADRMRTATIVGLSVLGILAVIVAGAAAAQRGPFYGDEPAHAETKGLEVGAKALAFDTKSLELPATNAAITLHNEDTQPHNISIFRNRTSLNTPLFRGEMVQPGQTGIYEIESLDAGVLYFHCDVHPNMNGQVVVT